VDARRDHAFTDVDAQPDPEAWIDVLDRLRDEPPYAAYKRRTIELLDPRPGGTYLEVGTGSGADAIGVARAFGVSVIGVDSSQAMVAEARRRGLAARAPATRTPCRSTTRASTAPGQIARSSTWPTR
jgi:protein-L-isoaspartate O-methyltransferase